MIPWEDMLKDEFKLTAQEGPFYSDYLINVQSTYPNAGLKSCPWNESETPKLYELKDVLIEHFDFIYRYREIGAETEERWQYTVDRIFDNIKRRYEFALNQYDENEIEKIGKYYKSTIHRDSTTESEGSSSSEGNSTGSRSDTSKSKFNDTPIQALMDSANYASSINDDTLDSESENNSTSESADTRSTTIEDDLTREYNEAPKSIMESVNDSIKYFRDLIDDFVDEFHVCFISTLGRI